MKQAIYLDYAAATPLDPKVKKAMEPFFGRQFYNPSATYLAGRAVWRELEACRSKVARLLGARPAEVIFTAGATEANNLAIQGIMRRFPKAEIIVSDIEHESVLAPAQMFKTKLVPVNSKGIIKLDKLEKLINDKTVLISLMLVNNELGTIQPLKDVARLVEQARQRRRQQNSKLPLYLHSDAAQAANYLDIHISRLGVDMLTINGGKIYGPKQSGALYVKAGIELHPLIAGGGQEKNWRAGTENLAGIAGFSTALELAQQIRLVEANRVKNLKNEILNLLSNSKVNFAVNGDLKHAAPHILNLSFPGFDNERLMMQLDELGIMVATGSACSASSNEPSHVLKAIGLSKAHAGTSLRLSFGRQTSPSQVVHTARCLISLVTDSKN